VKGQVDAAGQLVDGNGDGKIDLRDSATQTPTSLVVKAHQQGLFVHVFTFRNEERRLARNYWGDPQAEYLQFFDWEWTACSASSGHSHDGACSLSARTWGADRLSSRSDLNGEIHFSSTQNSPVTGERRTGLRRLPATWHRKRLCKDGRLQGTGCVLDMMYHTRKSGYARTSSELTEARRSLKFDDQKKEIYP